MATTVAEEPPGSLSVAPDQKSDYRYVWTFLVLCGVALAIAGWVGGALTFSGANFFFSLVERQALHQPYGRYSTAPFQVPALFASSITSSLAVLRHLFGLGYAIAPFGALLASWLVVRKRAPRLMIWPVIGITVVCFPGLLCLILESPIVAEWAWPLVLLTLVALDDGWTLSAGGVIAVFLFFCSANSLGVFLVVAVLAFIRAAREPALRSRLAAWGVAMVMAAPIEYIVRNKDFTASPHKISAGLIGMEFRDGYLPLPFVAYLLAGFACALLVYLRFSSKRARSVVEYLPTALVALAGACLVGYASAAGEWKDANSSKDLILLLELPLFAVAALDHLLGPKRQPQDAASHEPGVRQPVVIVAGVALLASLASWSVNWSSLMNEASRNVAASSAYCVSPRSVEIHGTPLQSQYTPELALDLGSRSPAHVVIDSSGCTLLRDKGVLELYEFRTRVTAGWFHFRR
jgi:hypothetical protein